MSISTLPSVNTATPVSNNSSTLTQTDAGSENNAFEQELAKHSSSWSLFGQDSGTAIVNDVNKTLTKVRDANINSPGANTGGEMLAMMDRIKKLMV